MSYKKISSDIVVEKAFAHLPFLFALGRWITALIGRNECLPLGLTRHCGQLCHRRVPIEIGDSLDNHNKVIIFAINLHFEDSDFALLFGDFRPKSLLRVAMTILANQLGIVGDVKNLHVAFGGLIELPYRDSIHILQFRGVISD